MRFYFFVCSFVLSVFFGYFDLIGVQKTTPVELVVVIPSYNNQKWYKQNLDSVVNQHYAYVEIIYINDCSKDDTGKLVETYIKEKNLENKIKLVNNKTRKGALYNLYKTISLVPDHKVIVCVDGDDELFTDQALARIAQEYQDTAIWLTYGQYSNYPMKTHGNCARFPDYITSKNNYRKYRFVASHPRTFYAGLFKKIQKRDLIWHKNTYYPMAWDLALMLPMLEMATYEHFKFIPDILYKYNHDNPINDYKVNMGLLFKLEKTIRAKKRYLPLSSLPCANT